jgi:hypothetical protein
MSFVYAAIYAIMAFVEVFVLGASFLGALALILRAIIRACCKLKNQVKKTQLHCAFSRSPNVDPCWLQCPHRMQPQRG